MARSKKPKPSRLERTAYHEAGHVIMAIELRVRFIRATILPDHRNGSLGHVLFVSSAPNYRDDFEKLYRLCKRHVMFNLGGLAAEASLTGRRNWIGAQEDLQSSIRFARRVIGDRLARRWVEGVLWQTELFFQRPDSRLLVEAVAQALLAEQTVSARRLRAIVKKTSRDLPRLLRARLGAASPRSRDNRCRH
jgi:hypothetical protein